MAPRYTELGLLNLPDVPLRLVLDLVDFEDRLRLRMVSRKMNNRVLIYLKVLNIRMTNGVLPNLHLVSSEMSLTLNLKNEGPTNDDFKVVPWIKKHLNQITELRNLDTYHLTKLSDAHIFPPNLTTLTLTDRSMTAGFRDISSDLPKFLESCSSTLRSLSISTSSKLTGFNRMKNDLSELTYLHVTEHENCDWIMHLLSRCRVLKELKCDFYHSSNLSSLAKHRVLLSNLKNLKVVCFAQKRISVPGFANFLQKMNRLESISLTNMNLSDLDGLPDKLPVKEVKLHKCSGLDHFLSTCLSITSLSLHSNKDSVGETSASKLSNIRHLMIDNTKGEQHTEGLVKAAASKLEVLELLAVDLRQHQMDVAPLPRLKRLIINCCQNTMICLEGVISRCEDSLQELTIHQKESIAGSAVRLTGQKLPKLRKLSLHLNRQIKENDMGSVLAACGPDVEEIDLEGIWQVNMFNTGFPNLRRLNLVPRRQPLSLLTQLQSLLPQNVIITHSPRTSAVHLYGQNKYKVILN